MGVRRGLWMVMVFATLSFSVVSASDARELLLRCKTHDGVTMDEMIIDIDNKRAKWGMVDFIIGTTTENFVVARSRDGQFIEGIDTWVMDRGTGRFIRSHIGNSCDVSNFNRCSISGNFIRGVCQKPIL